MIFADGDKYESGMSNTQNTKTLSAEQTLHRLATQFTVRDIMVPVEKLVRAGTPETACRLLEEYQDFNLIPIEVGDKITGYIERNSPDIRSINLDMAVGTGCSILDIVDVFAERRFCFVLGKWGIEGYVHFSDLNHHLVKLPFYILLQAVESHVIFLIQGRFDEAALSHVFPETVVKNIIRDFNKNRVNDSDRSLLNEVNLRKMLLFATHFGLLTLNAGEINKLCRVRDTVAHATEKLIHRHDDVKRLMWTIRECRNILNTYPSTK